MSSILTVAGKQRATAPVPRGAFALGCLPQFRRDPLRFLTTAAREYGDVVGFRLGPVTAHLVNHPDHIAHVLQHNWRNYDKQTRSVAKIRATCGDSLLSSDGDAWLRQRRLIQPAFQMQALAGHVPLMASATADMLDRWQTAAAAGQAVNVVSEMARLTLVIAARVLLGSNVSEDVEIIEGSLATVLDDTWRRIKSVFDLSVVSPVFHRRKFRSAVASLNAVVERLIDSRRESRAATSDLLSLLVNARDEADSSLTDRELRDATLTLLLAGHETTANSLAWSLLLLSESENAAAMLRCESRDVLGTRPPAPDDVDRLTYASAVFAETIRLYPSIWIMERRVVADDEIAGYRIPAGSTLLISPYVLHRTAAFWPDPERFDPQRFARDREPDRPSNAYIPFGLGPHHCIGRHLAQVVAQVVLSMVARRFRLQRTSNSVSVPLPGITLRHSRDIWMLPVSAE